MAKLGIHLGLVDNKDVGALNEINEFITLLRSSLNSLCALAALCRMSFSDLNIFPTPFFTIVGCISTTKYSSVSRYIGNSKFDH